MKTPAPENKPLVNRLKAERAKDETFCSKLSTYMGFSTDTTIKKWIQRGRIPNYHIERVTVFLQQRKEAQKWES